MKKLFLLAATGLLLTNAVTFANGDKPITGKAKTEKCCKKHCSKPGKPCCDKSKCVKS